jgi:hypothetical protein
LDKGRAFNQLRAPQYQKLGRQQVNRFPIPIEHRASHCNDALMRLGARRRDFDNFTFDVQDVARRVVFHWPEARSATPAEDLCQVLSISFSLRAVCHLRTASSAWAGEIAWPRPTRPCLASRCAPSANTIRNRVALPPAKPHEPYENGLRIVSPSIAWPSCMSSE